MLSKNILCIIQDTSFHLQAGRDLSKLSWLLLAGGISYAVLRLGEGKLLLSVSPSGSFNSILFVQVAYSLNTFIYIIIYSLDLRDNLHTHLE